MPITQASKINELSITTGWCISTGYQDACSACSIMKAANFTPLTRTKGQRYWWARLKERPEAWIPLTDLVFFHWWISSRAQKALIHGKKGTKHKASMQNIPASKGWIQIWKFRPSKCRKNLRTCKLSLFFPESDLNFNSWMELVTRAFNPLKFSKSKFCGQIEQICQMQRRNRPSRAFAGTGQPWGRGWGVVGDHHLFCMRL